jgi:hypothetical protein
MILNSLRINQVSPAGVDWLARYLCEIEARELDHAINFFHDAAVTQVNDGLPLHSKVAVRGLLQRYFEAFSHVEHEVLNVFGADSQFAAEMLCHYTPSTSGQRITMPAMAIYERDRDGLIVSMRIYISATGMFEAFAAAEVQAHASPS